MSGPANLIFVGMAGSGKTTLIHRLSSYFESKNKPTYNINLDPACNEPPYPVDLDIRDTVNYKEVMKNYTLGPNGAIVTSLNLFATKIDQLMDLLEHEEDCEIRLIDTPGQIEVFTWSASGQIITEALSTSGPTIFVYVVDTPRSISHPPTFMANMTYACSILYKTKLPLVIAFTKTDVISCDILKLWMSDYEKYFEATKNEESFAYDLQRSMALVLEEFYKTIHCEGVSSKTGLGCEELEKKFNDAIDEYNKDFLPILQEKIKKRIEEQNNKLSDQQLKDIEKLKKDRELDNELDDDEFVGRVPINQTDFDGGDFYDESNANTIFRNNQVFTYGKHN